MPYVHRNAAGEVDERVHPAPGSVNEDIFKLAISAPGTGWAFESDEGEQAAEVSATPPDPPTDPAPSGRPPRGPRAASTEKD